MYISHENGVISKELKNNYVKAGYLSGSHEELKSNQSYNYDLEFIYQKYFNELSINNIDVTKFDKFYKDMYNPRFFKETKVIPTLVIRSPKELVLVKILEIDDYLLKNNLCKGMDKCSEYFKLLYLKRKDNSFDEIRNIGIKVLNLRKELKLPCIVDDDNIYGWDCSFLNFDDLVFKNIYPKDWIFANTSLKNTVFIDCEILAAQFVNMDLRNTVFMNCKFSHTEYFYKCTIDGKKTFVNCPFMDKKKFVNCSFIDN